MLPRAALSKIIRSHKVDRAIRVPRICGNNMHRDKKLLNEEQMRRFVTDGCITLSTDLPPEFHQEIYETTETVFAKADNPGNNILPMIPQLQRVFDDPSVHGALESLLGKGYYAHPHRHCHFNKPGSEGQKLHKDGWSRFQHRIRWAMVFYYPQDTPPDRGPSTVVPGSQYYNREPGTNVGEEAALSGGAGTVSVVHYDLWHRASANQTELPRYMMKFLFVRLEEPTEPSWDGEGADWECGHPMLTSMWDWHRGVRADPSEPGDKTRFLADLGSDHESKALTAAYALGRMGPSVAADLGRLLEHDTEYVRRNAAYGLTSMGRDAVPILIGQASAQKEETRSSAIDALGDIGPGASDAESVIITALGDANPAVRANAAHALGTIEANGQSVGPLVAALGDEDEQVRRCVALSLLRLGPRAQDATEALRQTALEDANRYVQAKALEALQRIGSPEAMDSALHVLQTARWCAHTGTGSPF